jgi:hypothetical protein
MKRLLILFTLAAIGCNNHEPNSENKTTADSAAAKPAVNAAEEFAKLDDLLKKFEEQPQHFSVASGKPSQVKGKKGTVLNIDPSVLETEDGKPLGKNIEVELKELSTRSDFLKSNVQTTCDGRLLVSGGAYYINMTSDGSKLKIKDGKTLKVQFPMLTDKKMSLFYGQRDSVGEMNWKETGQEFIKKTIAEKDGNLDTMYNRLRPVLDTAIVFNEMGFRNQKVIYQKNGSLIVGDTMSMTQKERKDYRLAKKLYDKMYDELNVSSLGWINCDRFFNEKPTDLIVKLSEQDSVQVVKAFLIFKDINSVISKICIQKGNFPGVPIGYKTRLITYGLKDGKMYADASDVLIEKDKVVTPSLRQINEDEYKKLLNSN